MGNGSGAAKPQYVSTYLFSGTSSKPADLTISTIFNILTMADEEIATRAPESDTERKSTENAEQSVFPGDTRAQEGASMGVRWSVLEISRELSS